jgi:hypothetical protein
VLGVRFLLVLDSCTVVPARFVEFVERNSKLSSN